MNDAITVYTFWLVCFTAVLAVATIILAAFTIVLALTSRKTAYDNYRVTGHLLRLPYREYYEHMK
jgi:cell division protein FtsX